VGRGFREAATGAIASVRIPVCEIPDVSEIEVISELARPWSLRVASVVTGAPAGECSELAAEVFASAAHPFDRALQARSAVATLELARRFEGPLASFWVQTFVALSQSLPAFLGNAWLALLQQPAAILDQREAVEELLRYAGPSVAQFRTATEDFLLGDAQIRRGDKVALMLAAANRDPGIFADPERLDLQRRPNPHLAFGGGAHSCIGAALIRMAATEAITKFQRRLGGAEIVDCQTGGGFAIRWVSSLRVRRTA
jgi:cytochrome P450